MLLSDGRNVIRFRMSKFIDKDNMTECQRLVEEGKFPSDYFMPEERCGFLVDENRKKLWAIQIDLAERFIAVCKRHDLNCYAIGGTALGALRHGGFIPWDDDMDFAMPRNDYEKLMDLSDEFSQPYFLQRPGLDNGYYYSITKLRNSMTAQVSRTFSHRTFNQGVCFDIFPFDRWNLEKGESAYQRINELNVDNSNYMRQGMINPSENDRRRIASYSGRDPRENLAEINRLATQYRDDPQARHATTPVCTIYPYHRFVFRAEWFDNVRLVPFENIVIPIPIGAEEMLNVQYGDWMSLPPIEKRGTWHANEIFDADKPYLGYLA